MAEKIVFATLEDYKKRYGETPERAETLLEDASALLVSDFMRYHGKPYEKGLNVCFDANACAVVCAIVSRALSIPAGLEGTSQYTKTAGPYSTTLTYKNPTGDLYITRSERTRLGLSGIRIGSIQPMEREEHEVYDGRH